MTHLDSQCCGLDTFLQTGRVLVWVMVCWPAGRHTLEVYWRCSTLSLRSTCLDSGVLLHSGFGWSWQVVTGTLAQMRCVT